MTPIGSNRLTFIQCMMLVLFGFACVSPLDAMIPHSSQVAFIKHVASNWTSSGKRVWTYVQSKDCKLYSGLICDTKGFITQVDLRFLNISGTLPTFVDNLSRLKKLLLNNNILYGPIPTSISKITTLNYLWLGFNQFTGTIPSSLGKLTNLESLWLGFNLLTGTVPPTLGDLSKLKNLVIDDNRFKGSIPSSIFKLKSLTRLDLSFNLFTGPVPIGILNLAKKCDIDLRYNYLSGTIDVRLSGYTLSLAYNCIKFPSGWKAYKDPQRGSNQC